MCGQSASSSSARIEVSTVYEPCPTSGCDRPSVISPLPAIMIQSVMLKASDPSAARAGMMRTGTSRSAAVSVAPMRNERRDGDNIRGMLAGVLLGESVSPRREGQRQLTGQILQVTRGCARRLRRAGELLLQPVVRVLAPVVDRVTGADREDRRRHMLECDSDLQGSSAPCWQLTAL